MSIEYHSLDFFSELKSAAELKISRARNLYDAVLQQRDYTLVQLLQSTNDLAAEVGAECLIVDVECHGVPPKNEIGIQFRERLALYVPNDDKRLVEVLALRKNFPILIHQNQGDINSPASLCLYFEPPTSVRRTWTPQAFLRRIQWWIEKSAKGELHPANQPVEHLFFATNFELILPHDIEQLRNRKDLRFILLRSQERSNGGLTIFLSSAPIDAPLATGTSTPLEFTLPPITHGFVERDPFNLGQLADTLSRRGVEIIPTIIAALQARVGSAGASASSVENSTVILLHIPICRADGDAPTGITHRAFIVRKGALDLGVSIGALFLHEQKYFRATGLINSEPVTTWREEPLLPMSVLRRNDAAAARKQSGITDEGPQAVLVGAGSLGSAMLTLWVRSGWGQSTVIDNDYVKPHNISRHSAFDVHVGGSKAAVVTDISSEIMSGTTQVTALDADACNFEHPAVNQSLTSCQLVIDASTTLEYPRGASSVDAFARQMSVFVTPNGNASVLLAEDQDRTLRLRTLESQYYRSVIQQEWGRSHLGPSAHTFWSGASCRDISVVMPYSKIMAHASNLSEQIQLSASSSNALIRVWERDQATGVVQVHDIPVAKELHRTLGNYDIFYDEGFEQQLKELRQEKLPNETGGVLLGYYDFIIGAVFLVAALPAPSDSTSNPASFERGIAGLSEAVTDANHRTGGVVCYVGEWHSHPHGCSANPSQDDIRQLAYLAEGMGEDGLPAIQIIVGDQGLNVIQGVLQRVPVE